VSSRRWGGSLPDRSSKFTKLTPDHIKAIRELLSSPGSLISTLDNSASPEDLAGFNNDWMGKYFGKSPVVVKPKTPEEIGKVMKYCYDNDIAVVPQGGNTGLVGKPVSLPGRVRQLIVRRLYTYTR
jgi:FAD/FMN-containing dehydrogenase